MKIKYKVIQVHKQPYYQVKLKWFIFSWWYKSVHQGGGISPIRYESVEEAIKSVDLFLEKPDKRLNVSVFESV